MSDTGPASTPAPPKLRDPKALPLAQLGIITTVVVLVVVVSIQGLYFYFQALEEERKLREYPPKVDVLEAQHKSLSNSQWIDRNNLSLDIRWARQLAIEDLRAAQKAEENEGD